MKLKKDLFYLFFPLLVGGVSALFSGSFDLYSSIIKPPLSPPGYVFGIVWPILYLLMGISFYYIKKDNYILNNACVWYYVQLFLNFIWSIIFFRFRMFSFSVVILALLILSVVITFIKFRQINKSASNYLIPYVLWIIFAFYLNLGIAILN